MPENEDNEERGQKGLSKEEIDALITAAVAEKLKPIKEKLDKAYEARDTALARVTALEKANQDAELERLRQEGKKEEALKLELDAIRAERDKLKTDNTTLTRDNTLEKLLASLDFRHENARALVLRELVSQTKLSEQGEWIHASGSSLNDAIAAFSSDPANEFLFKTKINSGGGQPPPGGSPPGAKPTSLFKMSQEEVLKLAEEGKLPGQQG